MVKCAVKIPGFSEKRPLVLFLDFDGTLSRIRKRPQDAVLPEGTRGLIARLGSSRNVKLVVITGRSLSDIRRRVGIKSLVYAGNHGLEIKGGGLSFSAKGLKDAKKAIRGLSRVLKKKLSGVKGVIVEDKLVTISVHYRMVPAAKVPMVLKTVRSEVSRYEDKGILRSGGGKKIVEIKPSVTWDKGKAALYIIRKMSKRTAMKAVVAYIGDDRTDEDAFRALRGKGVTIHVGPGRTAAVHSVKGTGDVTDILRALVKMYCRKEG